MEVVGRLHTLVGVFNGRLDFTLYYKVEGKDMTQAQVNAAKQLALAIRDAIRDLKEVPSGHLYARVMHIVPLEMYESIISALVHTNLVERTNGHLLRWKGSL